MFDEEDARNWLQAITLIKREIGNNDDSLTMVCQDKAGGISGASSFVILYSLMQEIDEKLPAANSQTQHQDDETYTINVFNKVKHMRFEKANMIRNFAEYSFLHSCLAYYANHKIQFDTLFKTRIANKGVRKKSEKKDHITVTRKASKLKKITPNDVIVDVKNPNNVYFSTHDNEKCVPQDTSSGHNQRTSKDILYSTGPYYLPLDEIETPRPDSVTYLIREN